jgi:hypothetical protein
VSCRDRVGVGNGRHAANPGHCLNQDFLPSALKLGREDARSRRIAVNIAKLPAMLHK